MIFVTAILLRKKRWQIHAEVANKLLRYTPFMALRKAGMAECTMCIADPRCRPCTAHVPPAPGIQLA
jgi:hypothetical protein